MIEFFEIKPDTAADFLSFFDNSAFSEYDEWAGCYCLEGHCEKHFEIEFTDRQKRRKIAEGLVKKGKLHGYLLREDGRNIGWVKLGDKADFEAFRDWPHGDFPEKRGTTASLYCIDLIPEYRGRGIAKTILEFAINDCREKGYRCLEVYPNTDTRERRNYRGHMGMYLEAGFVKIGQYEDFTVMQKEL